MPPRRRDPKTGEEQLTMREKLFIEYLAQGENQTNAAIKAGYAPESAFVTGSQKLRDPKIQGLYQARVLDVVKADTEEVHAVLAAHLRADFGDFDVDDFDANGRPNLKSMKQKGLSRLIKKIRSKKTPVRDKDGAITDYEWTVDLELHDSQAAAAKLIPVLGMAKAPETHPEDVKRQADAAAKEKATELLAKLKAEKSLTDEEAILFLLEKAPTLAQQAGIVSSQAIQ